MIEDDPIVIRTIEYALVNSGYTVTATTRAESAARLIDMLEPQLVVMDIIMPEVDTIEMMNDVRRAYPKVKIIAISGNPYLLTLAQKHGADHILGKPFGAGQLNALIKVALA